MSSTSRRCRRSRAEWCAAGDQVVAPLLLEAQPPGDRDRRRVLRIGVPPHGISLGLAGSRHQAAHERAVATPSVGLARDDTDLRLPRFRGPAIASATSSSPIITRSRRRTPPIGLPLRTHEGCRRTTWSAGGGEASIRTTRPPSTGARVTSAASSSGARRRRKSMASPAQYGSPGTNPRVGSSSPANPEDEIAGCRPDTGERGSNIVRAEPPATIDGAVAGLDHEHGARRTRIVDPDSAGQPIVENGIRPRTRRHVGRDQLARRDARNRWRDLDEHGRRILPCGPRRARWRGYDGASARNDGGTDAHADQGRNDRQRRCHHAGGRAGRRGADRPHRSVARRGGGPDDRRIGQVGHPGAIDVHTHMELPFGGTFAKDTFETGTRAAAFGGTTTIIDFAVQAKGQSLREGSTPGTPRPRARPASTTAST